MQCTSTIWYHYYTNDQSEKSISSLCLLQKVTFFLKKIGSILLPWILYAIDYKIELEVAVSP